MDDLQQIVDFFKTISDPLIWFLVGVILFFFFIAWWLKTNDIMKVLKKIEENTRK